MRGVSWSIRRIPLNTDIVPVEKSPVPKALRLMARRDGLRVKAGDPIRTGQRIAPGLVSPATGRVGRLDPMQGPNGEDLVAVSVEVAEKEETVETLQAIADFADHDRDSLLAAVSSVGLDWDLRAGADVAVVNCLDEDPIQTINQQAFRENSAALTDSLVLLKALTGAKRIVAAVTPQLRNLAKRSMREGAEIAQLPPVYPNGLPEIVMARIAGRSRGSGRGFVIGAERLLAVFKALRSGKPIQEKIVTLFVPSMNLLKNLLLRIGTPVGNVLEAHHVRLGPRAKLILGGAMRGVAAYSVDFPVTLSTDSIYVQQEEETFEYENTPCLNCGRCSAVCPVSLRVDLICRYSEYGFFEECRDLHVDDCNECGLCAYRCPARRPLIHHIKLAKAQPAKQPEESEAVK